MGTRVRRQRKQQSQDTQNVKPSSPNQQQEQRVQVVAGSIHLPTAALYCAVLPTLISLVVAADVAALGFNSNDAAAARGQFWYWLGRAGAEEGAKEKGVFDFDGERSMFFRPDSERGRWRCGRNRVSGSFDPKKPRNERRTWWNRFPAPTSRLVGTRGGSVISIVFRARRNRCLYTTTNVLPLFPNPPQAEP